VREKLRTAPAGVVGSGLSLVNSNIEELLHVVKKTQSGLFDTQMVQKSLTLFCHLSTELGGRIEESADTLMIPQPIISILIIVSHQLKAINKMAQIYITDRKQSGEAETKKEEQTKIMEVEKFSTKEKVGNDELSNPIENGKIEMNRTTSFKASELESITKTLSLSDNVEKKDENGIADTSKPTQETQNISTLQSSRPTSPSPKDNSHEMKEVTVSPRDISSRYRRPSFQTNIPGSAKSSMNSLNEIPTTNGMKKTEPTMSSNESDNTSVQSKEEKSPRRRSLFGRKTLSRKSPSPGPTFPDKSATLPRKSSSERNSSASITIPRKQSESYPDQSPSPKSGLEGPPITEKKGSTFLKSRKQKK